MLEFAIGVGAGVATEMIFRLLDEYQKKAFLLRIYS
jgi:hypothetical protein